MVDSIAGGNRQADNTVEKKERMVCKVSLKQIEPLQIKSCHLFLVKPLVN